MNAIYLDHSATTPLDSEVMAAMIRYFGFHYGNPSSIHAFGREAKTAVEEARAKVAALIGADPGEIIFTGGGTEADNLALLGVAAAEKSGKNHIITSAIEHPAVLNTCRLLEERGFPVTYLPVDSYGLVDFDDVRKAITKRTLLISIMHGNNELGTIEPIAAIGALAREQGIYLHTDAVQTAGKIPFEVNDLHIDLLSLAGHKLYGPKGIGALYVRRDTALAPVSYGGHQEGGMRAGTENVPAIVGLGKACEVALGDFTRQMDRVRELRDRLEGGIIRQIKDVRINTHPVQRLPHILNVSIRGISGETVVREMDKQGIAISAGSACSADSVHISPVISALHLPQDLAGGTVRFSLGKGNTGEEIDRAVAVLTEVVEKLRGMAELEAAVGMRGCR